MKLTVEDAFERLTCASLVVRDRVPPEIEEVTDATIIAAFACLDWGMREAPTTGLRELARKALANAVLPRPGSIVWPQTVAAFLVPEPPRPGAA